MEEGSLRRQLASKVLSHAVETMITKHGAHGDWIIAGDVNAPLSSGDFDALTRNGFLPLGAKDERDGALTYLKSPHSMIDHVFVSKNMTQIVNEDDFFIVAKDREIAKFVPNISDHRPIALRLSLDQEKEAQYSSDTAIGHLDKILMSKPNPNNQEGFDTRLNTLTTNWEFENLNKPSFMTRNAERFSDLRNLVNDRLERQYGSNLLPLTSEDIWLIIYVEAGFKNGAMNPNAHHSLGERGLLPLPSNIRYWIGNDAPDWDQLLTIGENIFHYCHYLGQLKNKQVKQSSFGVLYRDLFRHRHILESRMKQAKLLAGVVHGYFYSGNYSDSQVPFRTLLDGYINDATISETLRPTRYVHAGTSILDGRQRNIVSAAQDFRLLEIDDLNRLTALA